jgi:hypothetical protein
MVVQLERYAIATYGEKFGPVVALSNIRLINQI